MRDDVLDKLVQPFVHRTGLPVAKTATTLAIAYGALMVANDAWTFDVAGSSLLGGILQVCLAMYMVRALVLGAGMGPAVLGTPFAPIHMMMRMLFLGLGVASIAQDVMGWSMGLVEIGPGSLPSLAMDLSMLSVGLSMYVSICEEPPARNRRNPLVAKA